MLVIVLAFEWRNNRNMLARIAATSALVAALALPCSVAFFKSTYHKNRHSNTPLFRFEKTAGLGLLMSRAR